MRSDRMRPNSCTGRSANTKARITAARANVHGHSTRESRRGVLTGLAGRLAKTGDWVIVTVRAGTYTWFP